ncbi:penicillin-binding protein activator [Nioella sp.]|jgi:ABC-type branched-subunit amino acid transport system substrate-binding protein|uniref:penicillin-binding protein activator n=1 Tax=Nioella sp. TaxID=1912091 RepID=UPI0035124CA9
MFPSFSFLRKSRRQVLLLLSAGLLAACQAGLPGGSGPRVRAGAPIEVALLLPYGSASPGDEIVARSLENAARLAASEFEGVQLEITVYNTAADPAQAATVAREAIQQGARVIVGPLRSDAAAAAGVAVSNSNVAIMSFSNNTEIAGGNVFVLGHTFQNTADRIAGYAMAQGRNRVVILHAQNLAGEVARDAVQQAFAARGGTVAGVASFEFSQQGVVQAIPDVMEMIRSSDANGLVITSEASAALPLFAQLLPENGLDTEEVRVMGLTRWDIPPQTLELSGLQGGWFALPDPDANAAFNARYTAAFGDAPHVLAPIAYDAMRAIAETAAEFGVLGVTELTSSSGFAGANGVFRLRANGTVERAMAIATVLENQVSIIDPAPGRLGASGF